MMNKTLFVESLFTYHSDDDMCRYQSDFHYYYHIPSQTVFKESGLGALEPKIDIKNDSEIRIAKNSEIKVNQDELI